VKYIWIHQMSSNFTISQPIATRAASMKVAGTITLRPSRCTSPTTTCAAFTKRCGPPRRYSLASRIGFGRLATLSMPRWPLSQSTRLSPRRSVGAQCSATWRGSACVRCPSTGSADHAKRQNKRWRRAPRYLAIRLWIAAAFSER
jgi:hypothetical protein